jgi:hypothetical protein
MLMTSGLLYYFDWMFTNLEAMIMSFFGRNTTVLMMTLISVWAVLAAPTCTLVSLNDALRTLTRLWLDRCRCSAPPDSSPP